MMDSLLNIEGLEELSPGEVSRSGDPRSRAHLQTSSLPVTSH